MSTIVLERKPKARLTPEDFKAQLFMSSGSWEKELTRRVPVVWGQQHVELPVVKKGLLSWVGVFDRPVGGESIAHGIINNPRHGGLGNKLVLLNIKWP